MNPTIAAIFTEIAAERARQDAKWGQQNHLDGTGGDRLERAAAYAKADCDAAVKSGRLTWLHILIEEVAEALAETSKAKLRAELIQCAAVIVAWIEKIDRDVARGEA